MRRCLDKVKDWVIDSRDRLGADVRVAAKDITKEGGRPLHLTAYAVQEIHDPKVLFNNLFVFFNWRTSTIKVRCDGSLWVFCALQPFIAMDPLMNTDDGSYVVDDELFSSRADDVDAKCVLR